MGREGYFMGNWVKKGRKGKKKKGKRERAVDKVGELGRRFLVCKMGKIVRLKEHSSIVK